jgi:hypothetical protein
VVIAAILVPLSVVTVWAVNTITNTDRYVETVAPLAREKVVTNYVALKATDKMFANLQVQQKVSNALPPKADFLAAPITRQVHSFVFEQMERILASTWFQRLWDRANRNGHAQVVAFLKGEKNPKVEKAREAVVDVSPVVEKAITKLDQKGVTIFNPLKQRLVANHGHLVEVPLATKQQVSKIRGIFNLATKLGYALPFVALLFILAAVLVAVDRRKALLRCAVGASIGVVVLLTGLRLGRSYMIDHTQKKVDPAVTGTVFDTFLRYLEHGLRVVLLISLLLALLMWFIGPSSWARGLRGGIAAAARWVKRQFQAVNTPENRNKVSRGARNAATWCLDHASGLRIAGAVVAGIVILFGGNLSPSGVLWTAVVLAIYLLLLQLVLMWARKTRSVAEAEDGAPPPGADSNATTGSAPPSAVSPPGS